MTWLTRAAVERRSVTILIAVGLFIFGVIAWGSLKQELLPDVSFPVATVIAPFPAAGCRRRGRPGRRADRARGAVGLGHRPGQLDLGELDRLRHRAVRVRHRCRRGDHRDGGGHRRAEPARGGRPDRLGAEHQRLAGRHRRDQLGDRVADRAGRHRRATRSCPSSRASPAWPTSRSPAASMTRSPSRSIPIAVAQSGISSPADPGGAGRQQRHDPGRRAAVGRRVDPGHRHR